MPKKFFIRQKSKLERILNRFFVRRKSNLKWWMIYGSTRSGTTLMTRYISLNSKLVIADWNIGNLLSLVASPPSHIEIPSSIMKQKQRQDLSYIRFDWRKAFKDLSDNFLRNAHCGTGNKLDLIFKQASYNVMDAYFGLIGMWGEPERIIFCFREPNGYLASAKKKFPFLNVETLRNLYILSFKAYRTLGGDAFEYNDKLTVESYRQFLKPLISDNVKEEFHFKGALFDEDVTQEMWDAYNDCLIRIQNVGNVGKQAGTN